MECARPIRCTPTCSGIGSPICPAICHINGCECPPETVIDVVKKECVAPHECTGMNY